MTTPKCIEVTEVIKQEILDFVHPRKERMRLAGLSYKEYTKTFTTAMGTGYVETQYIDNKQTLIINLKDIKDVTQEAEGVLKIKHTQQGTKYILGNITEFKELINNL